MTPGSIIITLIPNGWSSYLKDSEKPSSRITEADLRGALSNDRLSDEEKELLAKEQEIQIKKSQRRKTDYQLSFALDVISGLNIYGIND